jgi:predicted aspartyl protease
MRKILIEIIIIIILSSLFCGCQSVPSETTTTPELLAEFEFSGGTKHILLPVEFEREKYQFVLDTGSTDTVFDDSFKDKFGKRFLWPLKVKGPEGKISKVEYFNSPDQDAYIGHLKLNVDNLKKVQNLDFLTGNIQGIIGMEFLKKYVVQIDYDNKKVKFFRSISSFKAQKNKHPDWGEPVPLHTKFLMPNVRFVKGNISDNMHDNFLVDTGWHSPDSLNSKIFDKVYSQNLSKIKSSSNIATNYNSLTIVGKFSVGSYEYTNNVFRKSDKSVLGRSFLSRHLVTFDFPNNVMYLQKGRNFNKQQEVIFDFFDLGLRCNLREGSLVVTKMDPNGFAYNKGVRENDILIKINELDVSSFHIEENKDVDLQLSRIKEKGEITFTFKRGEELIEVSFSNRKIGTN